MSDHPYSLAYFAQLQANYRAGKPGVWKRIALLREFLELSPTDTILETGFGQGTVAYELATTGAQVTAVDCDPVAIQAAQVFLTGGPGWWPSNLRLIQADLAALPFAAQSFTKICFSEVVEHLADPRPVLTELHRILRPGGRMAVTTWPNVSNLSWALKYRLGQGPVEDFAPQTPRRLRGLLEAAGFRVRRERLTNFYAALPNTRWEFDGCGQSNLVARLGERFLTRRPWGAFFAASINLLCDRR
jgi:SAM-dependent methyltransferase